MVVIIINGECHGFLIVDSKTLNLETKLSYVSVINFPSIQISRAGWYKCAVNLHEGGGNAATVDLPVTSKFSYSNMSFPLLVFQ